MRPRRHCRLCVLLLSQVVCSFSASPSACFSCVFICSFNKCNKAPACCNSRASQFRPLAQSRAHEAREEAPMRNLSPLCLWLEVVVIIDHDGIL